MTQGLPTNIPIYLVMNAYMRDPDIGGGSWEPSQEVQLTLSQRTDF